MSIVTTRVASARKVASEVIHLQLAKPEGFTWKTGEFARLGLPLNGEDVFRAYSIASPAGAKTVDFFIADVKDGTLSPKLNALRENDEILIDTEVGGFCSLKNSKRAAKTCGSSRPAPAPHLLWR